MDAVNLRFLFFASNHVLTDFLQILINCIFINHKSIYKTDMNQYAKNISVLSMGIVFVTLVHAQTGLQQYLPVKFSHVQITDDFWKPRIDKVATVTIPVCIDQTEVKTPRIRNFEIAAHLKKGNFVGIFYDDSDVYKALEAISYSLSHNPDSALEKKA